MNYFALFSDIFAAIEVVSVALSSWTTCSWRVRLD